jgi:hypothetical protein
LVLAVEAETGDSYELMHLVEIERDTLFAKPKAQTQRLLEAYEPHGVLSENRVKPRTTFVRVSSEGAERIFRIFRRAMLCIGTGIDGAIDFAASADSRSGFDDWVLGGELGLHRVGHYRNRTKKNGAVMRLRR